MFLLMFMQFYSWNVMYVVLRLSSIWGELQINVFDEECVREIYLNKLYFLYRYVNILNIQLPHLSTWTVFICRFNAFYMMGLKGAYHERRWMLRCYYLRLTVPQKTLSNQLEPIDQGLNKSCYVFHSNKIYHSLPFSNLQITRKII